MHIIILILWFAAAVSILPGIAPSCADLGVGRQIVVCLIAIVGAPFMVVASAIEIILDSILPEGWDDDDDNHFA